MGKKQASNALTIQAPEYTYESAEWIALEHARGDSLQALHELHPDRVPNPLILRRWRRDYPVFDLLMREAEHARAAGLVEETLTIADDRTRKPAQAGHAIRARQWVAERLDRSKWGQQVHISPGSGGALDDDGVPMSDDELQAIIRAGMRATSIPGEAERIENQAPGSPPAGKMAGLEAKDGSDPSEPKIFSESELPDPVHINVPDNTQADEDF